MPKDLDKEARERNEISLVPTPGEEAQAREESRVTSDAWWIPRDPITQRRLVLVLAKMAQSVLDGAGKPLPKPSVEETPDRQRGRPGATHLNRS